MVSRGQLRPRMPPLGFLVKCVFGDRPQPAHHPSISARHVAGYARARRLIHERHELVGKSGHRATDANSPHIGAAADSRHPATFGHVALHDWSPTAQFHDALRGSILGREVALLVVAGAVATFVYGSAE